MLNIIRKKTYKNISEALKIFYQNNQINIEIARYEISSIIFFILYSLKIVLFSL